MKTKEEHITEGKHIAKLLGYTMLALFLIGILFFIIDYYANATFKEMSQSVGVSFGGVIFLYLMRRIVLRKLKKLEATT